MALPAASGAAGLWALAAQVRGNMQAILEQPLVFANMGAMALAPSLIAAIPFILFDGFGGRRAQKCLHIAQSEEDHCSLNISNIGRVALPMQAGAHRVLRHVIVLPKFVQEQKTIAVLSAGGQMHISLACDEHTLPANQAQAILDRALELLQVVA
jgi:hypothetical protein